MAKVEAQHRDDIRRVKLSPSAFFSCALISDSCFPSPPSGVTSMMYHHHGLSYTFTGRYDEYFGMNTDVDAVVYLMLVNNLLHDTFPSCITI